MPDGNYVCHGDFHPGNIIIRPDHKAVVIDFMNVCRGKREYDIARTYYLLKEFGETAENRFGEIPIADIYLEQMKMSYKDIKHWVYIISEYRRYE